MGLPWPAILTVVSRSVRLGVPHLPMTPPDGPESGFVGREALMGPFVVAGVFLGIAVGRAGGEVLQNRFDAYQDRKSAEKEERRSAARLEALRTAIREQEVRDVAHQRGVDVDRLLADLESARTPSVSEVQILGILQSALTGTLSDEGRLAVERLLGGRS